jgi:hypothetical protein
MWAGSWETVIILAKPVIARTPTPDRGIFDFPLEVGAGERNRTATISLEG